MVLQESAFERLRLFEESGDGREHVVFVDNAVVGAHGEGLTIRCHEFPPEADTVVMLVDRSGTAEGITGIGTMEAGCHRVDLVTTVSFKQGIEVLGVLRPGLCDELTAIRGVLLVPDCDVAVDQCISRGRGCGGDSDRGI